MTVLNRLADWFRTPVIEVDVYQCPACGHEVTDSPGACPECGEPLEQQASYEYGYWGPLL